MTTPNTPQTLAQRLSAGKIPVPEALHYAMSLADALRKIHDGGSFHGAVTPSNVAVTAAGLDLMPALATAATVTPYTAPEVLQGKSADARSDIFAFGAIVFEMLTGRRAFEGDGLTTLSVSLTNAAPAPSGSPAVDRLVAGCVAKNPADRWQRMQKIIMELKLLTVAARRAEAPQPGRALAEAGLRSEMQQLEARIAARMEKHESSLAQMQSAASEAVNALRGQLTSVTAQIAAAEQRLAQPPADVKGMGDQIMARVEQALESVGQRLGGIEQTTDELRRQSATLQENVAADLHDFEQNLKTQTAAVEAARTAIAQTDDLVERVVEALELLQSSVLDQQEDRTSLVN